MRVKTMQVMWHDEKPVYSIDFHPSGIFATGGGDKDVKVSPVAGENLARVHFSTQTVVRSADVLQLWEVGRKILTIHSSGMTWPH